MPADGSLLGRTLAGRFRLTAFIGEGGMATVYRAEQEAEPHVVAVKILHEGLAHDPTFVGRFRREARAATRVVHPSSVSVFDTGVDGNLLYIAMELLAGQDLFEVLVLERRLAEARAIAIVAEVAEALAAAHAQGVIHRDLKPENIMLIEDPDAPFGERVKVLDFGIAKILERESTASSDALPSAALTGIDTVVGTPAYMSPEQCRGDPVGPTSDIYACGVLLYQLVSGRLPFSASSSMDVAVMHVRMTPPTLAEIVPDVRPELSAIVRRALAKWPSERPQSAIELRDELRAILPLAANERLVPLPLVVSPEAAPPRPVEAPSSGPIVITPAQGGTSAPVDERAPTMAAPAAHDDLDAAPLSAVQAALPEGRRRVAVVLAILVMVGAVALLLLAGRR